MINVMSLCHLQLFQSVLKYFKSLIPSKQFIHAEQQLNRLLGISFGGGINGY